MKILQKRINKFYGTCLVALALGLATGCGIHALQGGGKVFFPLIGPKIVGSIHNTQ